MDIAPYHDAKMMVTTHEWDYPAYAWGDLMSKVRQEHVPIINSPGSCVIDHWDGPAMSAFRQHVLQVLGPYPEVGEINLYAVVTKHMAGLPETAWADGYPHTHGYAYRSIVHYLEPGAGAPLVVWGEPLDQPCVVRPHKGLTVVFDGKLEHGFHNWEGSPRVALVAQQVPANLQRGN